MKRAAVPPARGDGASPVLALSGDESQSHELAAEIVEVKLEAPATSPSTPSASTTPPPAAPPSPLTRPPARGEAGYTLSGSAHTGYELRNGDGTSFDVRIGPNYKKTGKKAPSLDAPYAVATADLLRRPKPKPNPNPNPNPKPTPPLEAEAEAEPEPEPEPEPKPTPTRRPKGLYDVAQQIKLPPPPDPDVANDTGLPRRLVINLVLPNEQPSLTSAKSDGECVQLIVVFTASTAQLRAWLQSGAPAARLYSQWVAGYAQSTELKERLKLLSKVEHPIALQAEPEPGPYP